SDAAMSHRQDWARYQHRLLMNMQREREFERQMNDGAEAKPEKDDDVLRDFDDEPQDDEVPSVDKLVALLDGRVYVGAGLVSFPYEDKETGK
ncbi:hypothetical protein, partial [Klebsiella pneumoniae]|uniref:hypothetical protein n=1 Tax=Klebsiella pneumoniae TaxID=573 RepID=UPI00190F7830